MKPKINLSIPARIELANSLGAIERYDFAPRTSDGQHERISMFNADLATESFFSHGRKAATAYPANFLRRRGSRYH